MNLLTEAIMALGGVLLPVAAGLLLEELTLGGLVRLLLAPWPGTGGRGAACDGTGSPMRTRVERNRKKGDKQ